MVLQRLFGVRPARAGGAALYASAARQARDPAFYRDMGVADTAEGRFELYSLHVALIVLRLRGQGQVAADTAQRLFDTFVQALDDALREMAVGDLSVGKKMRKLGEAFYGRVRSYDEALNGLPDRAPLRELVERTVLEGRGPDGADALADYVARAADRLGGVALEDLLDGRPQWPEVAT